MSVPPNSQSLTFVEKSHIAIGLDDIYTMTNFRKIKKQWHITKIQASRQQTTNLKLNRLPIIYYLLKIEFYLLKIDFKIKNHSKKIELIMTLSVLTYICQCLMCLKMLISVIKHFSFCMISRKTESVNIDPIVNVIGRQ